MIVGTADMWMDDAHVVVDAGSSLVIPAGRKHGFRNIGSEILHLHAILPSAVFEAAFDSGIVQRWQISSDAQRS